MNTSIDTPAAETIVPVVVSTPVRPGISEAVLETAGIRRSETYATTLVGFSTENVNGVVSVAGSEVCHG